MQYDIIVIGSGPGGYVAAIRAAQLGKKVAIIERESLGGICLNWGCIPTKALLKSAEVFQYLQHASDYGITVKDGKPDFGAVIQRSRGVAQGMSKGVEFLMRKNKIEVIQGEGKLLRGKKVAVTHNGKTTNYQADHIILATGARARDLKGLEIDGKHIIGYRQALSMDHLPKSMVIMGAGAIGVEFAYFYNAMGTEVTIVEFLKQGLLPREDKDVSKELARAFKKQGINVKADTAVLGLTPKGDALEITLKNNRSGKEEKIQAEVLLSAVGIQPNTGNINLELLGIQTDRGWVQVDEYYRTNVPGIYAIGDIVPGPALAHVASAEGIICVEHIAGLNPEPLDYGNIPSNTYCHPEVASVGLTEEAAKAEGYTLKIGKFPFTASGKASAAGAKEGFVKVIYDAKYGELLGAHLIGANVTEMIAGLVLARKLESTGHEILKAVHPHPTMSEAVMEATAAAYGEVIHL